jgi:nucleoside-diphosphate-sugar epimerase
MRKSVLVTGASGCIGRHIVPLLAEHGWTVHAVSRQGSLDISGVTVHQADLLDPADRMRLVDAVKPSHLLHLAWYIAPGRWAAAPDNYRWVEASLDLVRQFREAGGERVVTAGSCLEYDWRYGYCSEERTPLVPHTFYGTCKAALSSVLQGYASTTGFSNAWARIFFLYGPHEHPDRLVAAVIRSLISDQPARCSHGEQVRDYLHVTDVADALMRLLESDVQGPINVASGRAVALKNIVLRIGELTGRSELIKLGAIPPASTDTPLVVADVTKLSTDLGWSPRISLDDGLRDTIAWWRTRAPLAV